MSKKFTEAQVLEAIKDTGGIMLQIAKKLDCDWNTARKYSNMWDATKEALKAEEEKVLDIGESQMLKQVQAGDGQMIRWMLSRKGRDRGYGDKQEIEHSAPAGININIKGKPVE